MKGTTRTIQLRIAAGVIAVLLASTAASQILSPRGGAMPARVSMPSRLPLGRAPDADREWVVDARVERVLAQMSLQQKLDYIGGTGAWDIKPLPQFGIPQIYASDASLGVRLSNPAGVSYPAGPALASSWNTSLAWQFGASLGRDTRQSGFQNILGPGTNMYRTPYAGRAFEYMSGEDPFLGASIVPSVIDGIQQQGVWATLKHLVGNDQEENRFKLDVQIDERTLREIYLVPFESAVKSGKPANIMCAFNKINSDYACESRHVETDVVKSQWGYRGFIESDYNAIIDGPKAALAGTDIDMPSGWQMNSSNLSAAVQNGDIPIQLINDKVRRILRQIFLYGFADGQTSTENTQTAAQRARSQRMALQVARQGIVLLKNQQQELPFDATRVRHVAVIGQRAEGAPPSGFGSANIDPLEYVSELQGITAAAAGAQVDFIDSLSLDPAKTRSVAGFVGQYTQGGTTVSRTDSVIDFRWSAGNLPPYGSGSYPDTVVWSGQITATLSGDHVFKVRADGAVRLLIDGQEVINNGDGQAITVSIPPTLPAFGKLALQAGQTYSVELQYVRQPNYFDALGARQGVEFSWASLVPPANLASYDAVLIAAGLGAEYEGEGFDRPFAMPEYQDELIANVAAINPHTTVVVHAGGAVNLRPWVDQVAGLLYAWYPGEMGGQAVADLLFGKVSPSGKLPITIEKQASDNPSYAGYPLPQNSLDSTAISYSEGLFMGYRGFQRNGVEPQFPFGFGLSYTSFQYSDLRVQLQRVPFLFDRFPVAQVSFRVSNTGNRAGTEIVQVYVGQANPPVARPLKELKGFSRIRLRPGQTERVTVALNARAFAYYDVAATDWRVDRGAYTVWVGGSSADLPLSQQVVMRFPQVLSVRDSLPVSLSFPRGRLDRGFSEQQDD